MIKLPPSTFRALCKASGLPLPVAEFPFAAHIGRRWRFDWAWTEEKLALEVDGGLFIRGRHNQGPGILKTHAKMNAAAAMGWRVLYTVPRSLCTPETLALIRRALDKPEAA